MPKRIRHLADFIDREMARRHMGITEFARFVGVGHSTISKHVKPKDGRFPDATPELLIKLSNACGVSLVALMGLAYPEAREHLDLSPTAMLLAQRIEKLPEPIQDFLLGQILDE